MRTLLYTGHDAAYNKLADITVPRMKEYADYHGYGFACYTDLLLLSSIPNGIYWTGVIGALNALEGGYERAIYLDVDQLITNPNKSGRQVLDYCYGFHVSKDWGEDAVEPWHFSMCGFFAHTDSISLLRRVLSMEPEWRDKPFPEQGPMQDTAKNFPEMVTVHPRRVFNCVPEQVCPGKVPEPWQPGDFAAHLTMLPIDERVKLAKEILAKL